MWQDNSVFYQIYPLGACGAPFENDGKLAHRLLKIVDWIPHLTQLGIDCVVFNPVFQSKSHGYDTSDFYTIDCRLGSNDDFKILCKNLNNAGIKIVLDAVFNHVGRDFFAFQDVLKNKWNSQYKDWFYIDFNGNNSYNDGFWYQDWEGNDILVKLNLQNPQVVEYLLGVVDFWKSEFHISGLRLDVAYCLDQNFLRTLHHHVSNDFFLYGETLHGDYNMWVNDDMLQSCTNYECYKGIYSSFNSANFYEILYSLNRQFGKDPWCLYTGKHLFNFVDNHDVPRLATILNDKNQIPLAYGLLFTMPGIPCLYYGSEWGIEGNKNWNDSDLRPEIKSCKWNELTDWIQKLIQLKHTHSALQSGDYTQIGINNTCCIYQRSDEQECLWICINMKNEGQTLCFNGDGNFVDLLSNEKITIHNQFSFKPYECRVIKHV